MTKEQLQNFKWQPPPENPPVVTPHDTYIARANFYNIENIIWERIQNALEGWEIIDFRPIQKGDESWLIFGLYPRVCTIQNNTYIDTVPRFIVKKKRVFTDTERLNYVIAYNKNWGMWCQSREKIDRVLQSRLANDLPIE